MELRVALKITPEQAKPLLALRDEVTSLTNAVLRMARAAPNTAASNLLEKTGQAANYPGVLRAQITTDVELARHNPRGGVKASKLAFDGKHLLLDVPRETVQLILPQERLRIGLSIGNYQRHLLRKHRWKAGTLHLSSKGQWYLRLQAKELTVSEAPFDSQLAEQVGQYQEIVTFFQNLARPLSNVEQAQLAFALHQIGRTNEAELELLRLSAAPPVDGRVWLGLSLLAGERRNHRARIDYATRGLETECSLHTRVWLKCSAGRGHIELGEKEKGLELIQKSLDLIPLQDLHARARALYFLQGAYAALDRFNEQENAAHEALRLFEILGMYGERLSLQLDLSYRAIYRGRLGEGQELLEETIKLADHHHDSRLSEALAIRAEVKLLQGEYAAVLADVEHVKKLEKQLARRRLNVLLDAIKGEALFRMGTWSQEEFEQHIESLTPSVPFDVSVISFYQGLNLYRHQLPGAREAFEMVINGLSLMDSFRVRAHAYLLDLERRTTKLNPEHLQSLQHLLDTVGGQLALRADAHELMGLYQECAEQGLGGRVFQRLAQHASESQKQPQLVLHTLGGFSAKFANQHVNIGLQKGQELLVYLAIHGATARDALVDALWDGRRDVLSYFKQAIRAVRKAFEPLLPPDQPAILQEQGLYLLHPALLVDLDVKILEEAARNRGVSQWEKALDSYQGRFLPNFETEWVLLQAEKSQEWVLHCALELGKEHLKKSAPAAERVFRRALELDQYTEEAWQGLFQSLSAQNANYYTSVAQERYMQVFGQPYLKSKQGLSEP